MFIFFDWTYIFAIIGVIICIAASGYMNSQFKKYSQVRALSGMTGRQAAEAIIARYRLQVGIAAIPGDLTDNFNPQNNTLSLSDSTYGRNSVAAIGIAAHECGHAIQHQMGYIPIKIRSAFVPIANIGSTISIPLFFIGLIISGVYRGTARAGQPSIGYIVMTIGIVCFSLVLIFQLITLPVEFNASSRGIQVLGEIGIIRTEEERTAVKKVLTAAALTYVAGALSTILQLLRLILIANSRRR